MLADSGVALRRKDGSSSLTPPLLPESIKVFAPLSPTCLLISTPRAHYHPHEALTRKIAAKANTGTAAWCQGAIYRPPSMPGPTQLLLAETPLEVRPPQLSAAPRPAPRRLTPTFSDWRAILEQLSHTPTDQPPASGTGGGR
ncbi:hypothetical protein [Streptomyces shenzhenensis]|uniref:Uncharacterized protein n=1 Tax=Streptomyces shenzhenensis TaxID=943815 RepID=A0A3M0I267_9ACTN|nr:hypothetical protein [Streptomyces shenzhenensis]RMB83721.1 hypothetical protein CTZ28_21595 [Streptomyces shenzhenensis]